MQRGGLLGAFIALGLVMWGWQSLASVFKGDPPKPKPVAAKATATPDPLRPRLHIVRAGTYCLQKPELGTVVVAVSLRNTGHRPARDVSILPTRLYEDGRSVMSPLKDRFSFDNVPADGKPHGVWASYDVGAGNVVVGCTASIDGLHGERTLRVEF
jgi:hypothetical protein